MCAMTTPSLNPLRNKHHRHQRGAAMLILMMIVMLGLITLFTFRMDRKGPELDADRKTALALAQAKEALLGYAAKDTNHPGSLPCPDANDDGTSDISDYAGPNCRAPVGRLPWRLLRLPDLRDGSGERLWYAVSPVFNANSGTKLNSTYSGQITIKDGSGIITYNASTSTGVIAVVIAPGGVLVRQGAASPQNRTCIVGTTCDAQLVCNSPFISVPKCNPINYLDLTGSEDNQDFVAGTTNGFIAGVIKDVSGNAIVNDRMITITASELFSVVTFRMAKDLASLNSPSYYPSTFSGLNTSTTIWDPNKWTNAVATYTPNASQTSFDLKFQNCAIIYTITGPAVTRNPSSC